MFIYSNINSNYIKKEKKSHSNLNHVIFTFSGAFKWEKIGDPRGSESAAAT